jgi:hypothetical protein
MQISPAAYPQNRSGNSQGPSAGNEALPSQAAPASGQAGAPPGSAPVAGSNFDPVPTISSMEALLLTRIRDATEDRKSIDNKLRSTQFSGAESLLRKMLTTAKYQPELHTISYEDRQKIYRYGQSMKRLLDALGSYDYSEITKLSGEIESTCSDVSLVDVRAFAAKNSGKALHWAQQAEVSQKSGDPESMNSFMEAALERAPLDQEVKTLIRKIQAGILDDQELVEELKRIVDAGDYRKGFERRNEFAKLLSMGTNSDLKVKFESLLDREKDVQSILEKCDAFERRASFPDVWIAISGADPLIANDSRLVDRKSHMTGKCARFINAYDNALEKERDGKNPLALAWYLSALNDAPGAPELIEKVNQLSQELIAE